MISMPSSTYSAFLEDWAGSTEAGATENQAFEISAVEVEEGIEIIKHISEYREKRSDEDHSEGARTETAEGRYTLGLLLMYTGDMGVAKDCLQNALDAFMSTAGIDHERTQKCKKYLDRLEEQGVTGEQFQQ